MVDFAGFAAGRYTATALGERALYAAALATLWRFGFGR